MVEKVPIRSLALQVIEIASKHTRKVYALFGRAPLRAVVEGGLVSLLMKLPYDPFGKFTADGAAWGSR